MRITPALLGFAALGFASTALAAPVSVAPITFSPEFQTSLSDELGVREGAHLQRAVEDAVAAALTRRGATLGANAPLTVEIAIVDADPNRPTMRQLVEQPGLDGLASISIGGAELHGVLRGSDGAVLREINHRRYNHSLADLNGAASTWSEARRAIRQFAEKVADAYVETAN